MIVVQALRVPVLSSRYLLDLAPAWVGAMLAGWLGLTGRCRRAWSQGLLGLALIGWLGLELHMNRALPGPAGSTTWAGVMSARDRRPERPPMQSADWGVALGDPPSGIPYDRTGWDAQSGVLQPLVVLFAKDPDRLELELDVRDQEGAEVDPEAIQAKIGLETLERKGGAPVSPGRLSSHKATQALHPNAIGQGIIRVTRADDRERIQA